ncbi:MAG: ABC transporter permease subunit [Planctomycetes bacterium]|nr:ABC transporter permease subunit [Planctomycetota bacterium]
MKLLTLTRRELGAYFLHPMAYIVLAPVLFFSGGLFADAFARASLNGYPIEMRHFIDIFNFLGMFVAPLMTMRLLAEEKKSGTFEMLVTAPVTDTGIVLSKYFAAVILWIFFLVPSLFYLFALNKFGANPDYGAAVCNYVGLVLLVGTFLAIGIFFSSTAANQIVAGILSFITLFFFYLLGLFQIESKWAGVDWAEVAKYASLFNRYQNFQKGVYDTRDVIYFLSLIAFFLFLTVKMIESRRWR